MKACALASCRAYPLRYPQVPQAVHQSASLQALSRLAQMAHPRVGLARHRWLAGQPLASQAVLASPANTAHFPLPSRGLASTRKGPGTQGQWTAVPSHPKG